MSFKGNGEVAVSDGALSCDGDVGVAVPFGLSHEFLLPMEGSRSPFTGAVAGPADVFLSGTGRRGTEAVGSCRRAIEEVGEIIGSWAAEVE
jgi:hypothetical protein